MMSFREEYQAKYIKLLVVGASDTVGTYALYTILICEPAVMVHRDSPGQ